MARPKERPARPPAPSGSKDDGKERKREAPKAARSKPTAAPARAPVETFEDVDLEGAVVLLAFPSAGSASSIAAHYLVRNLSLPLVGHLRVPELSSLVSIQDGRVTSAVRVFGGEAQCRIGGDCPRIYMVTTELSLPLPSMAQLAKSVLEWAAAGKAHIVVVLEAVVRDEEDDTPDVYAAAAQPKVLKMLVETGVEPMERALIAGITAHILSDAPEMGVRAGALLVEASRQHPDGRAAAALVEAVSKMVPDVVVDAKPLLEQAMELEKQIEKAREQAQPSVPPPATFI
jgi:predicted ATP-grasp superfamily ATP-dependent carboligase